jgi:hypothetical protein
VFPPVPSKLDGGQAARPEGNLCYYEPFTRLFLRANAPYSL